MLKISKPSRKRNARAMTSKSRVKNAEGPANKQLAPDIFADPWFGGVGGRLE